MCLLLAVRDIWFGYNGGNRFLYTQNTEQIMWKINVVFYLFIWSAFDYFVHLTWINNEILKFLSKTIS